MAKEFEINCLGMKCPRPIIEIAKAARTSPPGSILSVNADDLAFESDVNAWVENAGASIVEMQQNGRNISVKIKLAS
jgi:cysteine desulfurase